MESTRPTITSREMKNASQTRCVDAVYGSYKHGRPLNMAPFFVTHLLGTLLVLFYCCFLCFMVKKKIPELKGFKCRPHQHLPGGFFIQIHPFRFFFAWFIYFRFRSAGKNNQIRQRQRSTLILEKKRTHKKTDPKAILPGPNESVHLNEHARTRSGSPTRQRQATCGGNGPGDPVLLRNSNEAKPLCLLAGLLAQ